MPQQFGINFSLLASFTDCNLKTSSNDPFFKIMKYRIPL